MMDNVTQALIKEHRTISTKIEKYRGFLASCKSKTGQIAFKKTIQMYEKDLNEVRQMLSILEPVGV